MEFKLITEILKNINLENPELEALTQIDNYYSSLIFQPTGELAYSSDFIRLADENLAKAKFDSFFKIATEKKVAIAITPEYSCPWSSVESLINASTFPDAGNLWIVGCQSIKAAALKDIIDSNKDIKWVVESDKIEANLKNDKFFDPVCYIFKTNSNKGLGTQTVIIVQFKTHSLGGKYMLWEKDNFIEGGVVYVLENKNNSSRLATIICSDTFNANLDLKKLPHYGNVPYLIIHIQLNQAPTNTKYSEYRAYAYNMEWNTIEFLCVNWARNVILDGVKWNDFGGSAIYIQTKGINTEENRLNKNHKKGLYYTNWVSDKKKANIFFFNYDEYLFLFNSTKPSQIHAARQVRLRTGPEMKEVYGWDKTKANWTELETVDDGFQKMCTSLKAHGKFEALISYHPDKPLDVERLVYLSIGMATEDNWHEPTEIEFFNVKDDEINKKITFTHNPCPKSQKEREEHLLKYGTLECTIIRDPKRIPIDDLKKNCTINYRIGDYDKSFNINLYPINNKSSAPASGAFLGIVSSEIAKTVLKKMIAQIKDGSFSNRTMVWYIDNGNIVTLHDPTKPKITTIAKNSKNSIKNRR